MSAYISSFLFEIASVVICLLVLFRNRDNFRTKILLAMGFHYLAFAECPHLNTYPTYLLYLMIGSGFFWMLSLIFERRTDDDAYKINTMILMCICNIITLIVMIHSNLTYDPTLQIA